jgi:hypothetical protein
MDRERSQGDSKIHYAQVGEEAADVVEVLTQRFRDVGGSRQPQQADRRITQARHHLGGRIRAVVAATEGLAIQGRRAELFGRDRDEVAGPGREGGLQGGLEGGQVEQGEQVAEGTVAGWLAEKSAKAWSSWGTGLGFMGR